MDPTGRSRRVALGRAIARAAVAMLIPLAVALALARLATPPPPMFRHGFVAPGSLHRVDGLGHRFVLVNCGRSVRVTYHGPLPDTLRERGEVRVEGTATPHAFAARTILARCPSKYDAAGPPRSATLCDAR